MCCSWRDQDFFKYVVFPKNFVLSTLVICWLSINMFVQFEKSLFIDLNKIICYWYLNIVGCWLFLLVLEYWYLPGRLEFATDKTICKCDRNCMFDTSRMPLIHIRNNSGSITDPCGTPHDMARTCKFTPSNKTYCSVLDK